MSALYKMQYLGQSSVGMGAVYVGKGIIVGTDVGGGQYAGTYTEQDDRISADIELSMPQGGILVTGNQIPPGTKIPMKANWPMTFADGQAQQIMVMGKPV